MRTAKHTVFRLGCSSFLLLACAVACSAKAPDPRTVRGALGAMASALEARNGALLFRLMDQRARHAMASIVDARMQARKLIESDYPQNERFAAVASLGDGAEVRDAAGLFARRCAEPCMRALAEQIGVPTSEQSDGEEVVVRTARGTTLHMHAGKDLAYGLVWNTRALSAEREQASRELAQIRENADVYRRRRALESPRQP
jgi:hypothetical protein